MPPPGTEPVGPSDDITGLWVVGTVTAGGTGPCYGLLTDSGEQWALYSSTAGEIADGAKIKVRVIAQENGNGCTPGTPMTLLEMRSAG